MTNKQIIISAGLLMLGISVGGFTSILGTRHAVSTLMDECTAKTGAYSCSPQPDRSAFTLPKATKVNYAVPNQQEPNPKDDAAD